MLKAESFAQSTRLLKIATMVSHQLVRVIRTVSVAIDSAFKLVHYVGLFVFIYY